MKFRIVEQRGVFRIQSHRSYEQNGVYDVTYEPGKWRWSKQVRVETPVHKTLHEWSTCASCNGEEFVPNDFRYRYSYDVNPGKLNIYEFDTYKKAENYIKKFYGSTGVDAIEKPEWKTV